MKKQIFKVLRTITTNILVTTALSIMLMCFIAIIGNYNLWGVAVPFEMLLVNTLIHTGILALEKASLKSRILHYTLIFIGTVGLIIGFGFLFGWFAAFHIWLVCVVGIGVLALAILIDTLKINRDAAEINEKLAKRRERQKANMREDD